MQVKFKYIGLLFLLLNMGCGENIDGHESKPGNDVKKEIIVKDLNLNKLKIDGPRTILLESGKKYKGCIRINLNNSETKFNTDKVESESLIIKTTGAEPAIIDAAGEVAGIFIQNSRNIEISNLQIIANGNAGKSASVDPATKKKMRCGILMYNVGNQISSDILIENVHIKDIFYHNEGYVRDPSEVHSPNGTGIYGWGIRGVNKDKSSLSNVIIRNCLVDNVAHTGIKFTGNSQNLKVEKNKVVRAGGPGMQVSCVHQVCFSHNDVLYSGSPDDARKWGRGSGFWCWGSSDVLLEYNSFIHANGPADSAGAHIDFNCDNVTFQYNFSACNAGGFVEILGNNTNCIYRYNISINDGYRVKGVDGFQEGKTLWFSGFAGKNNKRKGPYSSYVYNNTIYITKNMSPKVAFANTLRNALVANNVFYMDSNFTVVKGDQYKPEVGGESVIKNLVIENNLYLQKSTMPSIYKEKSIQIGNPQFKDLLKCGEHFTKELDDYFEGLIKSNKGKSIAELFVPYNAELISKGIKIESIREDKTEPNIGLAVDKDYFGSKLNSPIIGAVNPKK